MAAQQLRHNEGKPRLTYAFCNHNAFLKLYNYDLEEDARTFPLGVEEVLLEITRFLARKDNEQDALLRALVGLTQILQQQLGGSLPASDESTSAVEYVFRCDQAWDEFSRVCERGAQKYKEDGNYRLGDFLRSYLDSALRHIRAFLKGEVLNDDGCHTLANALWNVWQALDQPEFRDNRLRAVTEG